MTRIMRDSTTPADIPVVGTELAAGYVNGKISQWPADAWERFPNAAKVTIDVDGSRPDADILDVEAGDATVQTAVAWVKAKKALGPGYPPILYCNRSTLTPLFNALNVAGYQVSRDFRTWIATLDGTETVPDMTGVTAIQYQGATQTGGHYDQSIVYDDTWKSLPPNPAPPTPILSGILVYMEQKNTGTNLYTLSTKAVTSTDNGNTWS